jgi:integrase
MSAIQDTNALGQFAQALEQGQARRLLVRIAQICFGCNGCKCSERCATSHCSTLPSAASFAAATVVSLKVEDIAPHGYTMERATVRQKKTGRPVRFELTEQTRQAVDEYLRLAKSQPGSFLFGGRRAREGSLTTRQYARLVSTWVAMVGLDAGLFGTHSLRRTKATLIYRKTGNLRAVQLLLGHSKVESTVRYLGIEVDDALAIAEQVDI